MVLAGVGARAQSSQAPPLPRPRRDSKLNLAADPPLRDAPVAPPASEKHRVRALTEVGTYLAVDWSMLLVTPPPKADPPGNVSVFKKLSGKAITFDVSTFPTNFLLHPIAGSLYYGIPRANGMGALESFGWALGASTLWETAEFPENFSINDEIVTPVAGASLGEGFYQLASWIDARQLGWGGTLLSTVLAPARRLNGALDGGYAPGPDGVLSAHARLYPGMILSGGKWHPSFGVEADTRLIQDRSYGAAGQGTHLLTDGGSTELSMRAISSGSGLADLRFSARSWIATLYRKDLTRAPDGGVRGFDLLAGFGPGYEMRLHDWDLARREPLDSTSLVQVPGAFVEVRRLGSPLRISARIDAALAFGGTRSVVLDADPRTLPVSTLPTPTRAYGYYFGYGPSVAASLGIGYGPASLTGTARMTSLKGIDSRDVWPGRHPTAQLGDSSADLSARLGYRLPWKGVEVSATAVRSLRWGHAGDTRRTVGQTSFFLGLGFELP